MKKSFHLLLALTLQFIMSSCLMTYGDNIARGYTPLKRDSSFKAMAGKPILLFFDGEPVAFSYDKLGIIEVKGNQYSTTQDLLDHLKFEANKNGADAVIAVKDGYATRESGVVFSKTPPEQYSSHIYTGIAVKLNNRQDVANVPADTTYLNKIRSSDANATRRSGNQVIGSVFLAIVLTGVLIYAVAHK